MIPIDTVAISQFTHATHRHKEIMDYTFNDHALGIDLDETVDEDTGKIVVQCKGIHPGTTASFTQLKCFDILIAINGTSIVDMSEEEIGNVIASAGRPIKLTFVGERKDTDTVVITSPTQLPTTVDSENIDIKIVSDNEDDNMDDVAKLSDLDINEEGETGLDEKAIEAELDGMLDFAATEIQKNVRGWRVRKVMKK